MAYAVIFRSHARLNPQLSTPTEVVAIFYSRVFHVPLNLNIFSQKDNFASYACTREHFMSLLITTKNTLIVMIHLFASVPRTFYESFKSFSVITAKHETDNRVDSTVRVSHIKGDYIVYPETTRGIRGPVLIQYD